MCQTYSLKVNLFWVTISSIMQDVSVGNIINIITLLCKIMFLWLMATLYVT